MNQKIKLVCECGTINQFSVERLDDTPKCGICSQPLFTGKPIAVGSDRFIKHIENSGIPVLIDFWARWCGPCLNFAPLFEEFANRVGNQLRLLKVDTEANQQAAIDFNIRSIPTLSLMLHGKEIARRTGGVALPELQQWVVENLTKDRI